MVRFVRLLVPVLALLAGCGASVSFWAWDHKPGECREAEDYGNGYWERGFCRDGKGVLLWSTWVF